MPTTQSGYRRTKSFHVVPTANEVSSGIVQVTTTSNYNADTYAVVATSIRTSEGVDKTNEAKVTYASGIVTIQNNSGFTFTTGDVVNMVVTYV